MSRKAKKILKRFQSEENRLSEESFAILLSEQSETRLFFINEDSAHTDGQNIVVDPAFGQIYADVEALRETERRMGLPADCSSDPWMALHVVTRALTIHECLHILYTPFPGHAWRESRVQNQNERLVLSLIDNIIEDRYINDLGRNNFPRYALFLDFLHLSSRFAKAERKGTASTVLEKIEAFIEHGSDESALSSELVDELVKREQAQKLMDFLHYMGIVLCYPEFSPDEEAPWFEPIRPYVEAARPFWEEGMKAPAPIQRYHFVYAIFEVIRELIPSDEAWTFDAGNFSHLMSGHGHLAPNESFSTTQSEGQACAIDDAPDAAERAQRRADGLEAWKAQKNVWNTEKLSLLSGQFVDGPAAPGVEVIYIQDSDISTEHRHIKIEVKRPRPQLSMRVAYQNICSKHRLAISSYRRRLSILLRGKVQEVEERKLFGSGISSRHLADVKKRYWYKNSDGEGLPELSIMILIDGSGSMNGTKIWQARESAVILREVLKGSGMSIAMAQHQAISGAARMKCEVLLPFDAKENDKYNLIRIQAGDGNRDGLALLWAKRFVMETAPTEKTVLIIIADGAPAHYVNESEFYLGPRAIKDTSRIARQLGKEGLDCIAIALDDASDPCYEDLKEIYARVIRCSDLTRLTGQLFGVISGLLD